MRGCLGLNSEPLASKLSLPHSPRRVTVQVIIMLPLPYDDVAVLHPSSSAPITIPPCVRPRQACLAVTKYRTDRVVDMLLEGGPLPYSLMMMMMMRMMMIRSCLVSALGRRASR
jgi:hypothetical protein